MQETRFNYLFEQYFKGQASPDESNEFLNIVEDDLHKERVQQLMEVYWNSVAADEEVFFSQDQRDKMFAAIFKVDQPAATMTAKRIKLLPRIIAAAAAIAFIAIGIYFFKGTGHPELISGSQYANDVKPGANGATLTLSSGKQIKLTEAINGQLAKEAGVVVTKAADGQLVYKVEGSEIASNKTNTLSTAKGESYMVTLPDQSKVWLNAASSLTYNTSLIENGKRLVQLRGEAYFEVAKDKAHPFIVNTAMQEVEVLGTHFNINSYPEEGRTRTTLLEGSVKVHFPATALPQKGLSREEVLLKPGQQAILKDRQVQVRETDVELAVAWKNNKFIFERLPVTEIMRMIARWYDVEVVYNGDIPQETFWGSVSRFENVSKVLKPLESTGNIRFKIEGRRIYVSKP